MFEFPFKGKLGLAESIEILKVPNIYILKMRK